MNVPHSAGKIKGPLVIGGVSLLTFVIALGMLYALGSGSRRARQVETSALEKGNALDSTKTKQIFQLTMDGGLQAVTVVDSTDERQIAAVQQYLNAVAEKFQRGDFSNARATTGGEIPGTAELKAGAGQMTIRYYALADGGQIRYTASTPELVNATHRWLMAQISAEGKLVGGQ